MGILNIFGVFILCVMFWIVLVYVFVVMVILFIIGWFLIWFSFCNEKFNVVFCYVLVWLCDVVEVVGFYCGEWVEGI